MESEYKTIETVGELLDYLQQFNKDTKTIYAEGGGSLIIYEDEDVPNTLIF